MLPLPARHVHIGGRIRPEDESASGNPAKHIVRASFSRERMLYIPAEKSADGSAKVVYQSKDGKTEQTFEALDWLARLVVHIPNKYEVDPLCCPNCSHQMRAISILEAGPPVKKLLEHLDLRDTRNHDPPYEDDSHIAELVYDDSDYQIPQYDYWD